MKRLLMGLILLLCLLGCSADEMAPVVMHEVQQIEVQRIAEGQFGVTGKVYHGVAIWNNSSCQIWVLLREEATTERAWEAVIGHEVRHCFEGSFHAIGE